MGRIAFAMFERICDPWWQFVFEGHELSSVNKINCFAKNLNYDEMMQW